ncbi:hypothetical protein M514_13444, partial [Trichuris suis]
MATTPAAPPCIVADKSNIGVGTSINSFSEFIIPDCANLRNMAKRICEQLLKRLRSIYAILKAMLEMSTALRLHVVLIVLSEFLERACSKFDKLIPPRAEALPNCLIQVFMKR